MTSDTLHHRVFRAKQNNHLSGHFYYKITKVGNMSIVFKDQTGNIP